MLRMCFKDIYIFYIFLLSFAVMFFEAFTISLVLPILNGLLNDSTDHFIFRFYNSNFFSEYYESQILIISIGLLILFFFSKILIFNLCYICSSKFLCKV